MDDFITYKNLSQYCMDYLGQIIERANDKNEAIKQQVTGVMPESERPFNVEDRLTASYTLVSGWLILLHASVVLGPLLLVLS